MWKNLRDGMTKCLKKICGKSGVGAIETSKVNKCKHFDAMLFIKDTIVNKITDSNINPSEDQSLSTSKENTPLAPPSKKRLIRDVEKMILDDSKQRKVADDLLIKALATPEQKGEDDAELLFCKSLAPALRQLDAKKKRMAKIEMQQVLLKYEFDD